jgi:hypothetical protein
VLSAGVKFTAEEASWCARPPADAVLHTGHLQSRLRAACKLVRRRIRQLRS